MKRFATGLLAMALVFAAALLPGTAFAASDADMVTDLVQLENGNIKVTAELKNAKEATGFWYIGVGPAGDENAEPVAEKEAEDYNGTSFTAEFDISKFEAGKYEVFIMFAGVVDGEEAFFMDSMELDVEGTDDGGNEKPSVTPKPGKDPVKVDPEQGKELKDKVKGGKLPKTATTHPTGAAAGLALLIGGLALLKLRRTA